MWKRISEWSAQGVVQAVLGLIVVGGGKTLWSMIDIETLVGTVCLVFLFFCTFFGMKLLHLPKIRFPTQEEYEALKVLGKLNKGTVHMTTAEKEPREK